MTHEHPRSPWRYSGLSAGQPVFSLSGELIGEVEEVHAGAFLIAREKGPGVWLQTDAVYMVEPYVRLICNSEGLGRWCWEPAEVDAQAGPDKD